MKTRLIMVLVPWLILTGMIVGAYLPIYRGEKYLLPVKPRDPRDFFRGNYVDLRYEFSSIKSADVKVKLKAEHEYRFGDRLFLEFENRAGKLRAVSLSDTEPAANSVYLKVQPLFTLSSTSADFDLSTGLESFFAPKEAAEEWENALRRGRVFAEVAIDRGGNARLVRLINEQPEKQSENDQE